MRGLPVKKYDFLLSQSVNFKRAHNHSWTFRLKKNVKCSSLIDIFPIFTKLWWLHTHSPIFERYGGGGMVTVNLFRRGLYTVRKIGCTVHHQEFRKVLPPSAAPEISLRN
jgi:hypothetical protein